MSETARTPGIDTDRNLLFGVLALQADLIDNAQFAEICGAWAARKDEALADLLVQRGWITREDRADIDRLLERKVRKHAGSIQATLAGLTDEPVRQNLAGLADPDIQGTLAALTLSTRALPPPTVAYEPRGRERYTLTRLHARGGIGQVWLAHDVDLGRDVALKELREDHPEVWDRFLEEARITGQLEHPGIVPVYELIRQADGGQPFYTMRFVRGRTLSQAIHEYHRRRAAGQTDAFDLRRLLDAFVAVCNAVAYAHSRGVLHRDLKGQNVALGDFGEVMVLDWGLAKVRRQAEGSRTPLNMGSGGSHDETRQGEVMGTPGFMSPEQARGSVDEVSERSDVYGLGAVLYEILTGRAPFTGTNAHDVLRQVMHEEPIAPRQRAAGVPPALNAVCLKALAKRPEERYASASALADEVRHWLADEPVAAYPDPWTTRTRRWMGRHRTFVTAGAAAVAVAVVGLIVGIALLGEANRRERFAHDEAVKHAKDAQQQREVAQANFRMAREAVEEYCTKVSDDSRLEEKGLHDLRRDLLRSAVKFHQKFVDQQADNPNVRADLGWAYFDLASLTSDIDDSRKAMPIMEQARTVFEQLANDDQRNPDYQYGLLNCYLNLGFFYQNLGDYDRATDAYRQGIRHGTSLVQDYPHEGKYAYKLGGVYSQLGFVQRQQQQLTAARDSFQESIRLLEPVVDRDPNNEDAQRGLAEAYMRLAYNYHVQGEPAKGLPFAQKAVDFAKHHLEVHHGEAFYERPLSPALQTVGILCLDMGNFDEAERAFREAADAAKQAEMQHPQIVDFQRMRYMATENLGEFYAARNQPEKAIPTFREAVVAAEKFLAAFPDNVPDRLNLGEMYVLLGGQLRKTNKLDEARQAFADALKTLELVPKKDGKPIAPVRAILVTAYPQFAAVLARLGRHAEAAAQVEALAALPNAPAESLYHAACALALAVSAAGRDETLLAPEREQTAARYAARAVGLLKQADAAGYFKDAARIEQLPKDEDLAPLRSRDDFKQWLSEIQRRPNQ